MVEGPRNNALIKVDPFDLQALCENTRSQNFNHKVASWPRSSTWKQRLLNSSWHWKQITNRAELGTSVWSKNVSSFFGSWSRGTIKPTIMINHDYSMIGVESVYSENRGLFLDESWPFIESKISRNKKMIIKNKKNQHWKLYSPLSDFLLLILQIDCCRLLIVFIFHLDAGCWAAGIYIFIYWKLCDMEKEGKLNVRQHIEKERLQLN